MNEEQQFQQLINRIEEQALEINQLKLGLTGARDDNARLRAALNNERQRANDAENLVRRQSAALRAAV